MTVASWPCPRYIVRQAFAMPAWPCSKTSVHSRNFDGSMTGSLTTRFGVAPCSK